MTAPQTPSPPAGNHPARSHAKAGEAAARCGAVDVGGTKMLAQLFGAQMDVLAQTRLPTPTESYGEFLDQLAALLGWLRKEGGADLPLGISIAGVVDPESGEAMASNLPVSGQPLLGDLAQRLGSAPALLNDCNAFTLSEAVDGAGLGARVVVGVIIGTGLAAGLCINQRLAPRARAQAVEIGHVGMPQRALAPLGLGLLPCGCGMVGCMERYVAGSGLSALARHRLGAALSGEELAARLRAGGGEAGGDKAAQALFTDWCALLAEALTTLQLTTDPDVIVLGGGLSAMPGLLPALTDAFARTGLPNTPRPPLRLARHGTASGVRGAAFLALGHHDNTNIMTK